MSVFRQVLLKVGPTDIVSVFVYLPLPRFSTHTKVGVFAHTLVEVYKSRNYKQMANIMSG